MGRHSTSPSDDLTDWRADRVGAARRGDNPLVLARMRSSWAVLGDTQFLPGYCVLLSDVDGTNHLTDLPRVQREEFLSDMALLGEAMMIACTGLDPSLRRINYEILGNVEPALHAHVIPRYAYEPEELRTRPVWFYDWAAAPRFDAGREGPLLAALRGELERRGSAA